MQAREEQEKHYSFMLQKLMVDLTPEEFQALESGNPLEGEVSTAYQTLNTILCAEKTDNANDFDRAATLQVRAILSKRQEISEIFHYILDDTSKKAYAFLQSYPLLLVQRANVKDASGRLFTNITVLELALWAANVWGIRRSIGAEIILIAQEHAWLKEKLYAQYENWEKNGISYELNGHCHREKQYDFSSYISILQIYYEKLQLTGDTPETVEFWEREVEPLLIKTPASTRMLVFSQINLEAGDYTFKMPPGGIPAMFERKKKEGLAAIKQFFQPSEQLLPSAESSEGKKGISLLIKFSEFLKEEKADVEKLFFDFKSKAKQLNTQAFYADYVFLCGTQIDRKRFCDLLEKFLQSGVPRAELQSFFIESAFVRLLKKLENEDNLLDVQILFTLLKTGIIPEEYYSVHVKSEENAPENLRERQSKLFAQAEKILFDYIERLPKPEIKEAQTLILKKDSPLAKFFSAAYKNKIALPTPAGYGTASWLTGTADKKDKQKSMAKSTQQIFTL